MKEHSNKDSSSWKDNTSTPLDGKPYKPINNHLTRSFRKAEFNANIGTKINNYSNDLIGNTESKEITADNAERNTRLMRDNEDVPRKKKTYHTEQIFCSLHDLILGAKSPTIQSALNKMDEEASQMKSSSPIPFDSIVEDQKKILAKTYNIHVKEFVPSLSKWTPQ